MKVPFYKNVDIEGEVDVDVEDILRGILHEQFGRALKAERALRAEIEHLRAGLREIASLPLKYDGSCEPRCYGCVDHAIHLADTTLHNPIEALEEA